MFTSFSKDNIMPVIPQAKSDRGIVTGDYLQVAYSLCLILSSFKAPKTIHTSFKMVREEDYFILRTQVAVGDLSIGTVINDVKDFKVLNRTTDVTAIFAAHRLKKFVSPKTIIHARAMSSIASGFLAESALTAVSAKVGFGRHSNSYHRYVVSNMRTISVLPAEEDYPNVVTSSPTVQRRLAKFWGDPVYVITGLKIAGQRTLEFADTRGFDANATARFDITAASAGPRLRLSRMKASGQWSEETTDCIFAIRVTELTFKRRYVICGPRDTLSDKTVRRGELSGGAEEGQEGGFDYECSAETAFSKRVASDRLCVAEGIQQHPVEQAAGEENAVAQVVVNWILPEAEDSED